MRTPSRYIRPNSTLRRRLTLVKGLVAVVSVALLVTGTWFCLPSGVLSSFPFACSIPASPLPDRLPALSPSKPNTTTGDSPAIAPTGSQEITDLTGQGDTLLSLLNANLDDADAARNIAASLAAAIRPVLNKPFGPHAVLDSGRWYSLTLDAHGRFLQLIFALDPANVFHAVKDGNKIRSWKEEVVLEFKTETITFPVRGSLTESVLNAGEGMELARKLTDVFRWDIDFQSESMSGDVCKVLFERRYADDRPSGYGRVLCALYNGRKTGRKIAVLFNTIYYDDKGLELKKNFLRSPLQSIRVTSKFGMRYHPIYHVLRHHLGCDYGAPIGTPVRCVASGVVTFAGWKGNYGRYVRVRHENGRESAYGHLHRVYVRKGQHVKQLSCIGLVGRTGDATGPHLHFELLVNGKHINPQGKGVRMVASLKSVPAPLKSRFTTVAQQLLLRLEGIALGHSTESPTSLD